jgi:hypothetical protein
MACEAIAQPCTSTTHLTAVPGSELPLQGEDATGTRDLAFHARLTELALQAENPVARTGTADC